MKMFRTVLLTLAVLLLQACTTSGALNVARDQYRHGSPQDALKTLSEASVSRRDKLLLYLDRGLIAQAAGDYETSIAAFDSAIRLVDELDYISVRDQSSALLSNDWATRYSGEYSERLWIHTFQMLNFLLIDQPSGAAVEARRAAAIYDEQADVLKQDVFTRSLMALSFLAAGQNDSANVEYRKLKNDFDIQSPPLLRPKQGELVLVIASGFIPPKLPGDLVIDINARVSFPYYAETNNTPPSVQLFENGKALDLTRRDTQLEQISKEALAKRAKALAARHILRIAAKYKLAEAVSEQDALAGDIAKLVFLAFEQADTRSWETLPAWLTLVRSPLPAGSHTLHLEINGSDGNDLILQQRTLEIELAPGQRLYKMIRPGINSN